MKRPVLHLCFWLVYLAYDTLLHYTWMGTFVQDVSEGRQLLMAITTAFLLLPIKLLLVYYIIGLSVKKILCEQPKLFPTLLELNFLFFLSVVLFPAEYYYVIYPHIYSLPNVVALFNARSLVISIPE
jgi:hypothetical protein